MGGETMRVNQTIRIGKIEINSLTNSSILQIGTSGAIKAQSEQIDEHISQQQADEVVENKIHSEIEPMLREEGLPIETKQQQMQTRSQKGEDQATKKAQLAGGQTVEQEQTMARRAVKVPETGGQLQRPRRKNST
jgi:spore germination protein PB